MVFAPEKLRVWVFKIRRLERLRFSIVLHETSGADCAVIENLFIRDFSIYMYFP